MGNENELILVPRLATDDKKLKSDLDALTKSINSNGGLKLELTFDTSNIENFKKQLTDLQSMASINVQLDLSVNQSAAGSESGKSSLLENLKSTIDKTVGDQSILKSITSVQKIFKDIGRPKHRVSFRIIAARIIAAGVFVPAG